MNRRIAFVVLFLCSLIPELLCAQTLGKSPSVDEQADSLAFAEMRNRMDTIRKERPTVALVLSGGGALGAAHIGVIKYLDELGVPVDMVVGTSMGGLVGGFYSLGYSGEQIDSLFRDVDWNTILSDSVPANLYSKDKRERVEKYSLSVPYHYDDGEWARRQGLGTDEPAGKQDFMSGMSDGYLYGFNIINYFSAKAVGFHNDMSLLDLPVPFVCTSTDLVSGNVRNWTSGALVDAVRSTMSLPLAFMPVRKGDKVYVDGGVRNNFPVDIARAMGADVVIGVDIHVPTALKDASGAAQLVYMAVSRPGNDQIYEQNIKDVDILLKPDLNGYGILSFNKDAVSALIDRGYEAAAKNKGRLETLGRRTGVGGHVLSAEKSVDIASESVKINSIEFIGLTDDEVDYFVPQLGLKAGKSYTSEDFEKAAARVYGTGAFSRVTYKLLGRTEPYRFELTCERGPVNEVLLGLRADSEGILSAAFGLGIGTNTIWGHKLMLSGSLGRVSSLELDWKYAPYMAPSLNAYVRTSYTAFRGLGGDGMGAGDRYRGEFWHNEASFFVSDNYFRNTDLDIGFKVENTPVLREFGGDPGLLNNWKSVWSYFFLRLSHNSLDDKYFPTRGLEAVIGGESTLVGYNAVYGAKTHKDRYVCLNLKAPLTLAERFSVIPSIYSRLIISKDEELASYYMGNVIGGAMYGRYFAHQIPFIGYNGVRRVGGRLGMAALDLRYKATSKAYISLIGQMYNDSIGRGSWSDHAVYAGAVQCSVKTMLGPVSANIHWSSDVRRVGFYISAGLDF